MKAILVDDDWIGETGEVNSDELIMLVKAILGDVKLSDGIGKLGGIELSNGRGELNGVKLSDELDCATALSQEHDMVTDIPKDCTLYWHDIFVVIAIIS